MKKSPLSKLFIDWNRYGYLLQELYNKIQKSGHKYCGVHGIMRGGTIIAIYLSHQLNVPVYFNKNELINTENVSNILICDDLVDTGETLKQFKKWDTAVLYRKPRTKTEPTYFAEVTDKWIVFPYEVTLKESGFKKAL